MIEYEDPNPFDFIFFPTDTNDTYKTNNYYFFEKVEKGNNINKKIKNNNYFNKKTKTKNNKRVKKKNKLKSYNVRKGDWLCPQCNNINFHFRSICNICCRIK